MNQQETAGVEVCRGEGGAGAYGISDGGGGGRRSGGRRVWTSMSSRRVWVVFGLAHHFRSAHYLFSSSKAE